MSLARVFEFAGVDYRQWRAVSRVLITTDFRPPVPHRSGTAGRVGSFLLMAFIYGMLGLGAAVIVVANDDALLTGSVALTVTGFGLMTALLAQHGATLLARADWSVLGPRPVSSRTIFAIRFTNILFHALLVTGLMAYPVVLAFTFAHEPSVIRGIASTVAILLWALALTFALVIVYGTLLRIVGGARLERFAAYMQLVVGFVTYGGFSLVTRLVGRRTLLDATMPESPWVWLLPPTWFSGLIQLANTPDDGASWLRVAGSIGLLVLFGTLLRGRLTAEYATALSESAAAPRVTATTRSKRWGQALRGERRAVATLARAHLKHDLRVRMGLFAVVPLLGIYLMQGLREQERASPFTGEGRLNVDMLPIIALMFPAIVLGQLERSESFKAAWIFDATPARRGELVLASKNVAVRWFLAPFTVLMALLYAWQFGNLLHGIVHALVIGLIGHAALQVAVWFRPRVPFAAPPDKTGDASVALWLIGVLLGGQLLLLGLQRYVYPDWWRVAAMLVGVAVLSWLFERQLGLRFSAQPHRL